MDNQEIEKIREELKKIQADLKKINNVLFGIGDDTRFKAKVRRQSLDGVTSAGLPIIVDTNGTRWSVTNVTKLN